MQRSETTSPYRRAPRFLTALRTPATRSRLSTDVALLLACGLAWVSLGCTTETEVRKTVPDAGGGTTATTATDGADGQDGQDGVDGTTSSTGTDGVDGTTSTAGTDGADGADAVDGTDAHMPSTAEKCGTEEIPDGKGIGDTCTDHAECETGYCYDEFLWNEDGSKTHRFCTVACTGCTVKGNCNEWKKGSGGSEIKCFPFTTSFINYYNLKWNSLCLAACQSDADCANFAGLTSCAKLTFGKDYDYGVHKVCQPPEFPKLDPDEFNPKG